MALSGAGLTLVALAGWAVASGRFEGDSSEPESVSPLSYPTPETPAAGASPSAPDASPTATTLLETAVLYSEFESSPDTLRLAPISNLGKPRSIAAIPHTPLWGITASLSPDGQQVAYLVLPPTVPDPERAANDQAEVWVQPLAGGEPRRLAQNADVRVAPVWSPDGGALVFQSISQESNSLTLFRVNVSDGSVSVLAILDGAAAPLPLAFAPNGDRFYVAQSSGGAADLLAIDTADGSVRTVTRIAGGSARGWRLSPDGLSIALVHQNRDQEWEVAIASLSGGSVSRLGSRAIPSGQVLFGPVWHPQQPLLSVGAAPGDGGGVLNLPLSGEGEERLPGLAEGFDVPLAWSPNGDYLVVQQFSEYPPQRRPNLYLLTTSGERQRLAEGSEVTFIGWLGSAE